MSYSSALYMHDLDRKAFDALNMFPQLVKLQQAYITNYDEKMAKIELLSSAIRLSDKQLPEIYSLLPPLCKKLDIEIPDFYMVQSRDRKDLNAFTAGITNPFICITSESIKQLPPDMISSILAHECGHIASKHYLYHSLARNFINGIQASPLSNIPAIRKHLSKALIAALLFWDRCSEFTADRAAVLCDGEANKTIDTLLRIHGFDESINRDEFIKQALDLKSFVNESDMNRIMEQLVVQWNSHPLLATRAFECFDWSHTEQYQNILNGTLTVTSTVSDKISEEVFIAEVSPTCTTVSDTDKGSTSEGLTALDQRLQRLDTEIERYTCYADKADYALAIASGIMTGVLDSILFSDTSIFEHDLADAHEQVNRFIQKFAENRTNIDERVRTSLKLAVKKLEDEFPVPQDNIWKGVVDKVTASNHHLADLAHHPTPLGLLAAIAVKFLRIGIFVNKDGEWSVQIVKIQDYEKEDLINAVIAAAITGTLNWIVYLAENKYEESDGKELPKAIKKLSNLLASTPMLIEVFKCADNWFGHLVSDMGGSKTSADKTGGMGIPGVFLSLLYEFSSLPIIKETGLLEILNGLYTHHKFDIRHELALGEQVKVQAISVAFNEIFVRLTYMLGSLANEFNLHNGFNGINWNRVIPFSNRTVDRMIAVSAMTFNIVDTGDAAIRAAVESGGDWVVFSGRFVARYNFVGAGRAVVSIAKEYSNEKKEVQLIHERMLLMGTKSQIMFAQLQEFKAKLNEKLTEYLVEDIEAFMEGFDDINEGLKTNNSDLVIKGNVTIQRVLGREPQFKSQKEFDDLMAADLPLQF